MELITVRKYDDYVNDLTKEMDKHLLFHAPKLGWSTYLWYNFKEDGVAIRYPGATRGHIEYDKDMIITDVVIYEDTGIGKMGCYKESVREAVKQFIGARIVIQEEKIPETEPKCMQDQLVGKRVAVVGHGGTGRKAMTSLLALTTAVTALGGKGAYSLDDMPKLPKYNQTKDRRVYGYTPKNVQGRNERCACGSGKKYKFCCGK